MSLQTGSFINSVSESNKEYESIHFHLITFPHHVGHLQAKTKHNDLKCAVWARLSELRNMQY